jgi:hypothetical protein
MIPLLAVIVISAFALWVFAWTMKKLFWGWGTKEEGRRAQRKWKRWLDEE